MGYDAWVSISKKKYTKNDIENLLLMLGYNKYRDVFYCGNDNEYKYDNGVKVYKLKETKAEFIYHVRVQIWGNGHDLKKANDTIKSLKKYCDASFESDFGKNRYFPKDDLIEGAENGCYIAASHAYENMQKMKFALSKFSPDENQEKALKEMGQISPDMLNANVYTAFLCAVLEEYFRFSYTAILRFSSKREKIINQKFSSYDLIEVDSGNKTIDEIYARTLSFQNIKKISDNFGQLDKIDIGSYLKKPYHGRKKNLYAQVDELFERRHNMIHHVQIDSSYNSKSILKEIDDMNEVVKRVYEGLCSKYKWEKRDYR